MNEELERLKTDLLTIIKEGQNLTEGYVEVKPGIRIKAGREREFGRLCDNYYEQAFNQFIENDTDTITPVYESLNKLVETETEEFYTSRASNFVLETKDEVERFKNLVRSYNSVDNAYKLTIRNLNDLYLKRENTKEWQDRVDELNDEAKRLSENSSIIVNQINAARRKVNETLIKYAEEQMQAIRDNFTTATRDSNRTETLDRYFVLANDKEEYDSLYRLTAILKRANEVEEFDKLVVVDDAMMVTEDQRDVLTSTTLPNIKLMDYIKAPEKKVVNIPFEKNSEFIERINEVLKALDEIGKKEGRAQEALEEKQKLEELLDIIGKANVSGNDLEEVWDSFYVLSEDRNKVIGLLNSSRSLRKLNPELAQDRNRREENAELIDKLYSYLDELASEVTNYQGVANLPYRTTNSIGDRAWVVVDKDWKEANRIIELIELLQQQEDDLISVWGIANIKDTDIPKFKSLANSTLYFNDKIPDVTENITEIENVREQLRSLIKKARETENAKLATNGLVLDSDFELYTLLKEKYNYLIGARASSNLASIGGVLIDSDYVTKYNDANNKIDSLINASKEEVVDSTVKEPIGVSNEEPLIESNNEPVRASSTSSTPNEVIDFTENNKYIQEMKDLLKYLNSLAIHNEEETELVELANEVIDILARAKSSKHIVDDYGLKLASEDDLNRCKIIVKRYNELIRKLNAMGKQIDLDKSLVPVGYFGSGVSNMSSSSEKIDFSLNDKEIADLKARLAKLSAKSSHNELERRMFDILSEMIEILENAKKSEKVVEFDGLKFANVSAQSRYFDLLLNFNQVIQKLNEINPNEYRPIDLDKSLVPSDYFTRTAGEIDFSKNDQKIAELKEEMSKLEDKVEKDELASAIYGHLKTQVEILERAKNSKNVVDMSGIKFASGEDQIEYLSAQTNLDEIMESLKNPDNNNGKKNRWKITGIREHLSKLSNFKIGKFVKEHKAMIRLLVGIGLGISALAFVLPQLVPAIIFSNACNAAAIPALSGFLNAANVGLATSFNVDLALATAGAGTEVALMGFVNALAATGVIGLGTALTFKGLNVGVGLSELEQKSVIQKMADLIEQINKQWLKLMVNVHESIELAGKKAHAMKNSALYNKDKMAVKLFKSEKAAERIRQWEEYLESNSKEVISDENDLENINIPVQFADGTLDDVIEKKELYEIYSSPVESSDVMDAISEEKMEAEREKQIESEPLEGNPEVKEALEEQQPENIGRDTSEAPAVEMTPEEKAEFERKKLGEEIKARQAKKRAELKAKIEARKAADEQIDKEIIERIEKGASGSDAIPVVEVPSTDEVIGALGSQMISEQEPEMLDVKPQEPESEAISQDDTAEIEKQIAERESQIKVLQDQADRTRSESMKITYLRGIEILNKEIEALRGENRGR